MVATRGTVLVVDDESDIRDVVAEYLSHEGFSVAVAASGEEALASAAKRRPDLVILDLILPGVDGLEVFRRLRDVSDSPVIMLTARSEERDRVLGLRLGADDYVVKPFSPLELMARVEAVLRRAAPSAAALELGPFRVQPVERTAWLGGRELNLTSKEFDLLEFMMRHPGQTLTRRFLVHALWGPTGFIAPNTLTVLVTRLREKIETDPRQPRFIQTVWGTGYRFVPLNAG